MSVVVPVEDRTDLDIWFLISGASEPLFSRDANYYHIPVVPQLDAVVTRL